MPAITPSLWFDNDLEEAIAHEVPTPVLAAALFARFSSRQANSSTMQMVSALRGQFGGHAVVTT